MKDKARTEKWSINRFTESAEVFFRGTISISHSVGPSIGHTFTYLQFYAFFSYYK